MPTLHQSIYELIHFIVENSKGSRQEFAHIPLDSKKNNLFTFLKELLPFNAGRNVLLKLKVNYTY